MKLIKDNLGKVAITVDKDYWNSTKDYDRLVVVQRSSNSYTTYISRKPVPAGTPLTDRNYWIPFSHFQEDYADWTNELQRTLNEYKSSVANAIMFEANKDFIENGVVTTITFSITLAQIPQTNTIIKFYKNNVLVSTATVLPQQFDNTGKYQWTDNTSVESLYKVEVIVNGNTYVGLWKINIAYDFYIGTGVDHVDIISNPNYKHTGLNSLAGNYYLTPSAGDYIYIVCINSIVPSNVKLSGFELPIAFYTTTTIDSKEYVVYRSSNTYQAGSFTVTINDVSYDNNSYITHLIEEVQKFNTKAEETEEKVETIADEETIEVIPTGEKQGKVALKNRPMKRDAMTDEVIQKGYVILKEGDDFKEVVESYTEGNVIFEIDYAFDLGGGSVVIPEGCTLKFVGGSIVNTSDTTATITGDDTSVEAGLVKVFGDNITIDGTWSVENVYSKWFETNEYTLNNCYALCSDDVNNNLYITEDVNVTSDTETGGIKSNTIINVFGTIKNTASDTKHLVTIENKHDVVICGGIWNGNKSAFTTSQYGHIINIIGTSYNVTVKDVSIINANGDGVYVNVTSVPSNININGCTISDSYRNNISIIRGNAVVVCNSLLKNTNSHDPKAAIDIEPNGDTEYVKNVTIEGCTIKDCYQGILCATSHDSYSDNIVIRNNLFDVTSITSYMLIAMPKASNAVVQGNVFNIGTVNNYSFNGRMKFIDNVVNGGSGLFAQYNGLIENCVFNNCVDLFKDNMPQGVIVIRNSTIPGISTNNTSITDYRMDRLDIEKCTVTGYLKLKGVKEISISDSVLNLSSETYPFWINTKCDMLQIKNNKISVGLTSTSTSVYRLIHIAVADKKVVIENNIIIPTANRPCVHTGSGVAGDFIFENNKFDIPDDLTYNSMLTAFNVTPISSGASTARPDGNSIYVGYSFFDVTLGKPIYAKTISGSTVTWVYADGTTIS